MYLEDHDYLVWLDDDYRTLTVMVVCINFFYAFHKNITDGSIYKTMDPIQLFKVEQTKLGYLLIYIRITSLHIE